MASNFDPNENSDSRPEQDPDTRRLIRRQYRDIQECLSVKKEDLESPGNDGLQVKLDECDDIFTSVKMTREAALDSTVVAKISQLGLKQTQALHTDFRTFDPVEFCQKVVETVGRIGENTTNASALNQPQITPEGWVSLGQAVQPFFMRAPSTSFMYGALDKDQPVTKQRQKKTPEKKSDQVASKEPEQVEPTAMGNTEKTTEEVARINQILIDNCPEDEALCFFEFVVNPTSFGHTIENIFHTSFLVRDGLALISLDHDQLPAIKPVRQGPDQRRRNTPNKQLVMSITVQEWKDLVETFNIREPMIPPRKQ